LLVLGEAAVDAHAAPRRAAEPAGHERVAFDQFEDGGQRRARRLDVGGEPVRRALAEELRRDDLGPQIDERGRHPDRRRGVRPTTRDPRVRDTRVEAGVGEVGARVLRVAVQREFAGVEHVAVEAGDGAYRHWAASGSEAQ
jgi:hypothetical protein